MIRDMADESFLALLFAGFLVLIFLQIVAPSLTPTWYSIDVAIILMIFFGVAFSYLPENLLSMWRVRNAITQYQIYGTMDNPLARAAPEGGTQRLKITMGFAIAIGLAVGVVAWFAGYIHGLDLSIVLPTVLASAATAGIGSFFGSDLIVVFIQPILEETLRAGVLDKTIAGWFSTWLGGGVCLTFFGLVVMGLAFNSLGFIGLVLVIIGLLLIYFGRNREPLTAGPSGLQMHAGIVAAAVFLAGIHGYVLSTTTGSGFQNSIIFLTIFFIALSELDLVLKSVTPSIVIHGIYNAIVFAAGNWLYALVGLFLSAVQSYIIYSIYPVRLRRQRS